MNILDVLEFAKELTKAEEEAKPKTEAEASVSEDSIKVVNEFLHMFSNLYWFWFSESHNYLRMKLISVFFIATI